MSRFIIVFPRRPSPPSWCQEVAIYPPLPYLPNWYAGSHWLNLFQTARWWLAWLLPANQPESWETDTGVPLEADSDVCVAGTLTTAGIPRWSYWCLSLSLVKQAGQRWLSLVDRWSNWGLLGSHAGYSPLRASVSSVGHRVFFKSNSLCFYNLSKFTQLVRNKVKTRTEVLRLLYVYRDLFNADCISFLGLL